MRDLHSRHLLEVRHRGLLFILRRVCRKRSSEFGDVDMQLLRERQVRFDHTKRLCYVCGRVSVGRRSKYLHDLRNREIQQRDQRHLFGMPCGLLCSLRRVFVVLDSVFGRKVFHWRGFYLL